MSGFDADWLALRERADTRARTSSLVRTLRAALTHPGSAPLEIVDLGSGTGNNLRYLAPRLGGRQRWRLIDNDPRLLDAFVDSMRVHGFKIDATRAAIRCAHGARWRASVTLEHANLAGTATLGERVDLVCASALIDLVGRRVLDRLLRMSRRAGACVLIALSYDGRVALSPRDALDRAIIGLVNRHQRRDKGMGAALGPTAALVATRRLSALGYRVHRRRSDWVLTPDDASMQRALIDGWAEAAAEQSPSMASEIAEWRARRHAHIDRTSARARVGHVDLLALPR